MRYYSQDTDFTQIETFTLFIGYPRSGHTLVGSLMDAHPEMVIAHELGALEHFVTHPPIHLLYKEIVRSAYEFTQAGRQWMGYNYKVPGQWQGKSRTIKVIGDKSGGWTSRFLLHQNDPHFFQRVIDQTQKQLRVIHIIRNPFDNISTMVNRTHKRNRKSLDESLLELKINHYFKLAKHNQQLIKTYRDNILNLHLEEFIDSPKQQLQRICAYLGLEASSDYLEACASIVWKSTNRSRHNLKQLWTNEMIDITFQQIQQYDFLKRYQFDS